MALSRIWVSMICVALVFGAASGRGAQLGAAAAQGVTEALKERDPMAWVGAMNSLKAQAEEVVLNELVYA